MQRRLLFFALISSFFAVGTRAQNTSPFWSLAGNSNATATSKLGTTNSNPLNLTTNNITRLKIFAGGQSGFGANITTANATRVLNLADPNAVMRILRISGTNAPAIELLSRTSADGANVAYWDMYAEPSDKSFRIRDRVTGSNLDRLTINRSGYVGIGTTSPAYLLDVNGRMRIRSADAGNTAGLWLNNTTNSNATGFMGVKDDENLGFYGATGYGWSLLMNATTGNVSIGTGVTASYPLDVANATAYRIVNVTSTYSGTSDHTAIYAGAHNGAGYGIGVNGYGGYIGTSGQADAGAYQGSAFGVYGYSSGTSYNGNRMGVYGYATGGVNSYGVYGEAGTSSTTLAAGYFVGNVYANAYYNISDRKFKQNITPVQDALSNIMKLKPSAYEFKTQEYKGMGLANGKQLGLVADEVKQVFPELVQKTVRPARYDDKDRTKVIAPEVTYEAVNYQGLIPVLIASTQEQQKQIENLKQENEDLKGKVGDVEELKKQVAELKALLLNGNGSSASLTSAYLGNASPNPSNGSALVRYGLPDGTTSARLTLVNAKGQVLKEITLGNRGAGQVNINTAGLPAGIYTYSLQVDGQQAASKQLVIAR